MAVAWRIVRPATEDQRWHRHLDEAVVQIRAGRLADAENVADEAISCAPDDEGVTGRAFSFKGEIASIRGALDETMAHYERAIADLESTPLVGSLARARRGRAEAFANLALYSSALEEANRARLLVDSIARPAIRRRAELESNLIEGLIRFELNQEQASLELWQRARAQIDPDCDPLLVGQHYTLGGLAFATAGDDRTRGFALLERASAHFQLHELPYHRARSLEGHARAIAARDVAASTELAEEAIAEYDRVGAALRSARTRQWLDDLSRLSPPPAPGRLDVLDEPVVEEIDGVVLAGPSTRRVVELAQCAAATASTVLITGESGTGKEQIARLIHARSRRAEMPWVALNCATVPPDMIESVLFGHRKGAFTGAHSSHDGLVRAADGGTFFLDELGELPLAMQAKLLRFLQESEILPLGETRPIRVDVRIVAATNRDLERETRTGAFRTDLYHRLNVIRLQVAPLRDRRDEVPVLARRLACSIGRRIGVSDVDVTAGAIGPLLGHDWPGNVRELSNVLERSLTLYGPRITRRSIEASLALSTHDATALPQPDASPGSYAYTGDADITPLAVAMDTFERSYIERVVAETNGNRSRAAVRLGVSLQRLRYRMRRLGMG